MDKRNKIKEIIKGREIHLVLYTGFMEKDKRPFHAFVAMGGVSFDKFQTAKNPIVLGEYGEVLYSDEGHEVQECIAAGVVSGFKKRFKIEETDLLNSII